MRKCFHRRECSEENIELIEHTHTSRALKTRDDELLRRVLNLRRDEDER